LTEYERAFDSIEMGLTKLETGLQSVEKGQQTSEEGLNKAEKRTNDLEISFKAYQKATNKEIRTLEIALGGVIVTASIGILAILIFK